MFFHLHLSLNWKGCSTCHVKCRWLPTRFQTPWWLEGLFYLTRGNGRLLHFHQRQSRWAVLLRGVYQNLSMMCFKELCHPVVEAGREGWELPAVKSTTQLCGDSRRSRGSVPSSRSWLVPPPKVTDALRRLNYQQQRCESVTLPQS